MKTWDIFELYVVETNEHNHICTYSPHKHGNYKEVLTGKKISDSDIKTVEELTKYHSILAVADYKSGETVRLNKWDILSEDKRLNLINQAKMNKAKNQKNISLEEQINLYGMKIFKSLVEFIDKHKEDDDKLYKAAILKLPDGRTILVSFSSWDFSWAKIEDYHWNEEIQKGSGVFFHIYPKSAYGFLTSINLCYLDKKDIDFKASEKKYPYNNEITKEEQDILINYIKNLYEQLPLLKYDRDATHSINNLTYEAKKEYNIQQFNETMEKLNKTDARRKILPSVETAVNWWINQFTGTRNGGSVGDDLNSFFIMLMADKVFSQTSVDEKQLSIFRQILSNELMDELSKGMEPKLQVDYGPTDILDDAMTQAGISGSKAPFKTSMVVGVNSVKVSAGYGAKYVEIYDKIKDEYKVRKLTRKPNNNNKQD